MNSSLWGEDGVGVKNVEKVQLVRGGVVGQLQPWVGGLTGEGGMEVPRSAARCSCRPQASSSGHAGYRVFGDGE